jgi:N-acetylglucosaminyl-diphospho-decaprenol L-rhamnosyltransferase
MDDSTSMGIDFSIIIVNMNSADWLRICLQSIKNTRDDVCVEVILVDNGSTDDSIEIARDVYPEVLILPQGRNIGYVPANNVGLAVSHGRYAMFLNNDTKLLPGCLGVLRAVLDEQPEVGAISGQILNPDGSDQGTARRFPSIANGLFGRRSFLSRHFPNNPWTRRFMLGRQQEGEDAFEVEILSSACLVVRTPLANELDGMDEDFDLYWVDAEMCGRIRDRGYKVYCAPRAKLIHYEGQGGSTKTFRQRVRATVSFHRDAYLAYTKVHKLSAFHIRSLFTALALSLRAAILMIAQLLRPGRATSSGGKN